VTAQKATGTNTQEILAEHKKTLYCESD